MPVAADNHLRTLFDFKVGLRAFIDYNPKFQKSNHAFYLFSTFVKLTLLEKAEYKITAYVLTQFVVFVAKWVKEGERGSY